MSIGFGKWHGISGVFGVPGRVFRAFNHLDFRQLFSSLMDTKPPFTIKNSKSDLPVLEGTSNRARWTSYYTNTECKIYAVNYRWLTDSFDFSGR
jgi:hypothetical protein